MSEGVQEPKKIYLFTWENVFSLSKELKRWKDWFRERNWSESVFHFNRENRDYGIIKQTIFSGWFFVTNKLVVLEWLPQDTEKSNTIKAEELEKISEDLMNLSIPKEVLILCVSYKPDKRWRFYKRIEKTNKENSSQELIKSFDLLKDYELTKFVADEWKDLNLSKDLVDLLVRKVWNDQFRLASEIDKLRYWKKYYWKEITSDIIDEVCFGIIDEDVFKLLDLSLTNPKEAVKSIQTIQDMWTDWNAINWSFVRWLRNYLFVLDYAEHWITDSKQIAADLKQNPWVISNIIKKLPQIKAKKDMINSLFEEVLNIDYDIKSWNAQPSSYYFTIKKVILRD